MAELIEMSFGLWTRVGPWKHALHGGILAPPGEYHWTVRVWRRCSLMSNYFNHVRWSGLDITRMWANAQRDGRPAEYRWRPLFNAAKFGW